MKKLLFLAALFTATVMNLNAETVTNVKYIDASGIERTCPQATLVESSDEQVTWKDGWYVVTGTDVTLSKGAKCEGYVNLILADGAKLTANGTNGEPGIYVNADYSLTIYGQQAQTGALIARGGDYSSGIGGDDGDLNGHITINGGVITAIGGNDSYGEYGGAGIGSGWQGKGSNITINGGKVTAIGGPNASGIGSGYDGDPASKIYVNPSLLLKADNNNPPTTVIAKNRTAGTDIADSLASQRYATVAPPAEPVAYLAPVFNTEDDPTSGILRWDTLSCTEYTVVESAGIEVTWNAGWYVVTGTDVTLSRGAKCNGQVHLILADGAKLTATGITSNTENHTAGIGVMDENSLTIYGQQDQTGKLIAKATDGAGIGGDNGKAGKNITINGGVIEASSSGDAAGIGGGYSADASNITINGGTITATGGAANDGGAGIGSGTFGNASNITINGGTVTATGGSADTGGAGIGGYYSGSNITINGGTVTANGGSGEEYGGAGIGGGGGGGKASDITINGGTVTANGGAGEESDGAGIGGGGDGDASKIYVNPSLLLKADNNNPPATEIVPDRTAGTDIASDLAGKRYATVVPPVTYIKDDGTEGSVKEYTVVESDDERVTWEDGWYVVTGKDVTLSSGAKCEGHVHLILADGAKLTANGTDAAAGIIVNEDDDYSLTIYGQQAQTGALIAQGGDNGAGIGGEEAETNSPITINGGVITATGGNGGAGIGGGNATGQNITINGGVIHATGKNGGAGIGGGYGGWGESITIRGGVILATGNTGGAGIGAGSGGSAVDITITGGTVTANGSTGIGMLGQLGAAGIGGSGDEWQSMKITITGGKVTALGGTNASGIGRGSHSSNSAINIYVDPSLILKADNNNPPTTVIAKDRKVTTDIADSLAYKQFATVSPGVQIALTAEYGTYISANTLALPEGLKAYSCAEVSAQGVLQLEEETKICENTPYIIQGTAGNTYTCEITSTGTYTEPVTVGLLTGVYTDTDLQSIAQSVGLNETAYVLALQDGRVAFYSLENKTYTQVLPANRCYLKKTNTGGEVKSVIYFDEETAIESIQNAEFRIHNDGKYLENGKIVIVKNNAKYNVAGQMIK